MHKNAATIAYLLLLSTALWAQTSGTQSSTQTIAQTEQPATTSGSASTGQTTPTGQTPAPAAAPAAPAPLSSPAMTGPLSNLPPATLDLGPIGKVSVNGIVSGLGLLQTNHGAIDQKGQGALSNGQIFVQKADGLFQFYFQAGAYDLPSLGASFLQTDKTMSDLYGPVPVGYLKLAGKNTSIQIGSLPTLIGAEYTFSFENMNIERGLLWNQETAISKGIQLNQTMGKFSASLSWNDGFYSNRYTWLSGSLAYTNGPHALSFVAAGNYGQTAFQNFATPLAQNNSAIYNVIYTYSKGSWVVTPYFQYTNVPTNAKIGITKGASTTGGAVLVSHTLQKGFSVAARYEYLASSGSIASNSVNLLYGPGSSATSLSVTPTYQSGGFFTRAEASWVHTYDYEPGLGFGTDGLAKNQVRAVLEVGFIFGDNLSKH
jgi:hypothetical protein